MNAAAQPTLALLMGCNGAGKTEWLRWRKNAWCRAQSLARFVQADRLDARHPGMAVQVIGECFEAREPFGVAGTFAGNSLPGPALVTRALESGYRLEGYYIGTESWEVNRRRLEHRASAAWPTMAGPNIQHGPRIDPETLPNCWRESLANLREVLADFDRLQIADNSRDTRSGVPDCVVQFVAERGKVVPATGPIEPWADELMRQHLEAENAVH